jgi:transposase IS116/IS110/IS902 family protein
VVSSQASATMAHQIWFCAKSCSGRFRVCGDQGGVDVNHQGPRGVDAGVRGQKLLTATRLSGPLRARVHSQLRLITALHFGIELFAKLVADRLRTHPGYTATQIIPGVGPILAAVFVAEIGDITHFGAPEQLTSWAGLTPKHHESDTTVHRGRITATTRCRTWVIKYSHQLPDPGYRAASRVRPPDELRPAPHSPFAASTCRTADQERAAATHHRDTPIAILSPDPRVRAPR